ncbi:hypothetical protein EYF80_025716 [Liparis tanakae]|uniref:Uncharacterized protein n=1 Tax=Liparis tanakae TaxID=230148 RepID=A0A4Z2HDZ3_9TELE|nr:hypothetical protein EYF80_025716 [Liparis tanakae]
MSELPRGGVLLSFKICFLKQDMNATSRRAAGRPDAAQIASLFSRSAGCRRPGASCVSNEEKVFSWRVTARGGIGELREKRRRNIKVSVKGGA